MTDIKFMKLTIGEKFTALRNQAGKTLDEVAGHLKMETLTYIKIENDFVYPSDQQIAKLGRLYNLTYEEVIAVGEE
ncbi:hypothetical protein D3C87_1619820 [compost metagenome]